MHDHMEDEGGKVVAHLEAKFLGNSGQGFQEGSIYQIQIHHWRWSTKLSVIATHGYECKPIKGMELVYANVAHFLRDWRTLRVQENQLPF